MTSAGPRRHLSEPSSAQTRSAAQTNLSNQSALAKFESGARGQCAKGPSCRSERSGAHRRHPCAEASAPGSPGCAAARRPAPRAARPARTAALVAHASAATCCPRPLTAMRLLPRSRASQSQQPAHPLLLSHSPAAAAGPLPVSSAQSASPHRRTIGTSPHRPSAAHPPPPRAGLTQSPPSACPHNCR